MCASAARVVIPIRNAKDPQRAEASLAQSANNHS